MGRRIRAGRCSAGCARCHRRQNCYQRSDRWTALSSQSWSTSMTWTRWGSCTTAATSCSSSARSPRTGPGPAGASSPPRFKEAFFVVKEFAITYHVPITRIGPVHVQLWLDRLGNTSAVYGFRVLSEDETVTHAEGRRVQVRLDPATLRPAT